MIKKIIAKIFGALGRALSRHRTDVLVKLGPIALEVAEAIFHLDLNGDDRVGALASIEATALRTGGELAANVLRDGELRSEMFAAMPMADLKRWVGTANVIAQLAAAGLPIPALGRIHTALQSAYEWLDDQRNQSNSRR